MVNLRLGSPILWLGLVWLINQFHFKRNTNSKILDEILWNYQHSKQHFANSRCIWSSCCKLGWKMAHKWYCRAFIMNVKKYSVILNPLEYGTATQSCLVWVRKYLARLLIYERTYLDSIGPLLVVAYAKTELRSNLSGMELCEFVHVRIRNSWFANRIRLYP